MIVIINQYKEWTEQSSVFKLFKNRNIPIFQIYYKVASHHKIKSKYELLFENLISLLKIIFSVKRLESITYVLGLHFSFFIIARFFKRINDNVIIDNFYLHEIGERDLFKKFLRWLLKNKKYRFVVQSEYEVSYYKAISDSLRVIFIPYAMSKIDISKDINLPSGFPSNYIFTGGYTNRDYDLVLQSAKTHPDLNFVIVMSRLNFIQYEIPQNVFIYKDLEPNIFNFYLSKSDCVIVPLKDKVGSSGQMLCLSAMQMGKPLIYSKNSSIDQYFINDNNGISYEINKLSSLNASIEKYKRLTDAEKKVISDLQKRTFNENFTTEKRSQKIMEIFNEMDCHD